MKLIRLYKFKKMGTLKINSKEIAVSEKEMITGNFPLFSSNRNNGSACAVVQKVIDKCVTVKGNGNDINPPRISYGSAGEINQHLEIFYNNKLIKTFNKGDVVRFNIN